MIPAPVSSVLTDWLSWLENLHPKTIELGLERVQQVAAKLQVLQPACPVITVGGTNGKGSCVAFMQTIYLQAGYRVGAYTSPHLLQYNERIQIDGQPVSDALIVQAFQAIEAVRGNISLTYFEYGTLAALWLFKQAALDIMILEVGLGGRLDAVNLIDADVAIIASIDLDHTEWLGTTREAIGTEKAGILRPNKPVVCGDLAPPLSLLNKARQLSSPLYCQEQDFRFAINATSQNATFIARLATAKEMHLTELPLPILAPQNAATALMAISLLQPRLPVTISAIKTGLAIANVPGRFQLIRTQPNVWVDVAHNPAAAAMLATKLRQMPIAGKTYAVFSALQDKDVPGIIDKFADLINHWFIAPLPTVRSHTVMDLSKILQQKYGLNISAHSDILMAYQQALAQCQPCDRIIVFGSFYTVAAILNKEETL